MLARLLSLIVIAATLVGCAPARDPRGADSGMAAGIIGGRVTQAGDAEVTFTVAIRNGSSDVKNDPTCSGVLIGPTVVLTAAHCVYDDRGAIARGKLRVAFGPDGRTADSRLVRAVQEVRAAPGYLNLTDPCPFGDCEKDDIYANFNPSDLALVRLTDVAPAGTKPARLADPAWPWPPGDPVFAAGYGYNVPLEDLSADEGQYLKQTGSLRQIARRVHDRPGGEDTRRQHRKIYIDEDPRAGICHGDSGGPLYFLVDGEAVVIGVASHSAQGDLSYACAGRMDAYNDVAAYNDWISPLLAAWSTPNRPVQP